jgi:hypothetical protein
MINYIFYIKGNPLGASLKIGISALRHVGSRLGTYQNSFGPDYEDRFEQVWVGEEAEVRELERLLKIKYRRQIAGNKRGYTEWIKGVEFDVLAKDVDDTIQGLGLDIVRPTGVTKVFEANIEELRAQYLVEETTND